MNTFKSQLQKAFDYLKESYAGLQMGRAATGILENVSVESYGMTAEMRTIANISVADTHTLRVEPWDKSQMVAIEKGIREADLGLNPQNMGGHLLIPIPPMTEERRKRLVKVVHEKAEECKIAMRNIRQDELKSIKEQAKTISEDEVKRLEKEVQDVMDTMNKEVDSLMKAKEMDIMKV